MSPDRLDVLAPKWRSDLAQLEALEAEVLGGKRITPPGVVVNLSGRMEALREVLRDVDGA